MTSSGDGNTRRPGNDGEHHCRSNYYNRLFYRPVQKAVVVGSLAGSFTVDKRYQRSGVSHILAKQLLM